VRYSAPMTTTTADPPANNFLEDIVEEHVKQGRYAGRIKTRFPPEPNGYLHIGHAKSICLNFGLAKKFGGTCNLRFDDTNPLTEDTDYVQSIQRDIRWLGFQWDALFYASDYFEKLYERAEELIKKGKAYVCDLTAEQVSAQRGTFETPGTNSPFRDRSVDENLDLFRRMRKGEFKDGEKTLRAKIDMAHPNPNLRDPAVYRIRHAHHHRTGDAWCIYPLYDFTHCLSDAIESISHSVCTLEFENRRVLYDWVLDEVWPVPADERPHQYEFSRLKLNYTVMSKRKLIQLVKEKHVDGWDDPRMLTLSGLRRRGYTPASIRELARRVGVTKTDSWTDMSVLEQCVRDDLNEHALRALGVLRPLKVVIENWPAGTVEHVTLQNHPQKPELGTRTAPFSGELYIEREDFEETPPKGFFRLAPGQEVRLRGAYFVKCTSVVKDGDRIVEVRCTYDPATKGGDSKERKVKGTLHWVSAPHALTATVRLYDRLFAVERPDDDFLTHLNPKSLEVVADAKLEASLKDAAPGTHLQLERLGYFFVDPIDSKPGAPVLNRTVTLKDGWAKELNRPGR
jgi:glutaminyl-tRNA synthetase